MTLASSLTTIVTSIAGLSVSGLTIKNTDAIPEQADLQYPLLVPRPNEFITDLHSERTTFGINGTARVDLTYNLNYVFLYAPAGTGVSELDAYNGMITMMVAIINAIMSNDTLSGAVDVNLDGVSGIGIIQDPANNQYWGCFWAMHVTEYVQP